MKQPPSSERLRSSGWSDDWTAVLVGLALTLLALGITWWGAAQGNHTGIATGAISANKAWDSPVKPWLGRPRDWAISPWDAFRDKPSRGGQTSEDNAAAAPWNLRGLGGALAICWLIGLAAAVVRGLPLRRFAVAFPAIFVLALLAYAIASQTTIKSLGLEYALWALLLGLFIANVGGTPQWLRPAVASELYIKIGLVLFGASLLFGEIIALGLPGICVAWIVTPIVLVATYLFGQYVLKIESKTLNIVVSADMSVCGVSAAIATSAACRAKKEELSLAIGLSLTFTVLMMIAMPRAIQAMGLDARVGGAWIGGTIDSTGAVAAAGEALGPEGSKTAVTIKMIQNIMIGVVALAVAFIWARWVEPQDAPRENVGSPDGPPQPRIGLSEIWIRFPKFILGFLGASLLCSLLSGQSEFGKLWVKATVDGVTKELQGWLFCLAFVCIGLETDFRRLWPYLKSGKAVVLYVCGQSFNLVLTLAMAYLMFGVLFTK